MIVLFWGFNSAIQRSVNKNNDDITSFHIGTKLTRLKTRILAANNGHFYSGMVQKSLVMTSTHVDVFNYSSFFESLKK